MDFLKANALRLRQQRSPAAGSRGPAAAISDHVSELRSLALTKIRLVTYAWGRQHVEDLLNYALPSVLAPGNLPALSTVFDCVVVVVTEEAFFADVRDSPACHALQRVCPLKLVSLDDLVAEPWQYGMTIAHSLFRGFEDLGPCCSSTPISCWGTAVTRG
jgi:hypothetical protein